VTAARRHRTDRHSEPEVSGIDRQIVERPDQEEQACEKQKFVLQQGKPLPQTRLCDGLGDPFPQVRRQPTFTRRLVQYS
jgi:hypothetical protein